MAAQPPAMTAEPEHEAHTTHVVVWDVPPAVTAGERFRISVGIKCETGCRMADGRVGVYDETGTQIATGALSGEPWPGTSGLFVSQVEVAASASEGLHTWTVKGPDEGSAAPHAWAGATIGIRVVAAAGHLVTVEAIDAEARVPLPGARVVMHPYQAITDDRGVAEVRVAKGAYRLFVSQTRYSTIGMPIEVDADLTTRVELPLEVVPERN